jgi:restriction endonuclease-like protein
MTVSIRNARAALAAVRREQEAWARDKGWEVDANSYVADVARNLLLPLSAAARKAYEDGAGSELIASAGKVGKMASLISSSALAFNFFAPFEQNAATRAALARAMDLDEEIRGLQFERKCPTGMAGTPPHLDVVLELGSRTIGVESKFTEWLVPKASKTASFDVRYLQRREKLWDAAGLPRSQAVGEAIASGELQFAHVDALQLLKHALGLRACFGEKAALAYVYLERPGEVGISHVRELDVFTSALGGELNFRSWTYQELFAGLRREPLDAALDAHLKVFAERYLGTSR